MSAADNTNCTKGVVMSWTEVLRTEIELTYTVTEKLLDLTESDKLHWKPSTGNKLPLRMTIFTA